METTNTTLTRTELIMGMPITVMIALAEGDHQGAGPGKAGPGGTGDSPDTGEVERRANEHAEMVFDYLREVDARYSPYKPDSEVSQIASGTIPLEAASSELRQILRLAEDTKVLTHGYCDVWFRG